MSFGRPGPGYKFGCYWLYQLCICTNYPNQWNNVDSGTFCLYLKQDETMNLKYLISYFTDPQHFDQ